MTRRFLTSFLTLFLTIAVATQATAQSAAKGKSARPQSKPTTDASRTDEAKPKADTATEEKTTDPKTTNEAPATEKKAADRKPPKLERATFGGGCFWCTEAVFERIPGVQSVVSGYAGGSVPNPSYQQVGSGLTGHAEVIQVVFDPSLVTYESLLIVFFLSHDPTTLNSQGPDFGTQYRSIILFETEQQKQTALKVINDYKAQGSTKGRRKNVTTEVVPLIAFYAAEPYHQNYYQNHYDAEYSQIYIAPKLKKLEKLKLK